MSHTTFVVSPFENRNGVTSWRVDGRLHGVRFRKNFKTREEAAAEQATLELKALNAANGLRTIATVLTPEQVREAEAVFHRLADGARPLSFYVDFAVANYREPERQKLLADAAAEYVAAKEHELKQDHISRSQMERIRMDLKR
ncbi:MAG: site-specific integrase, partial [Opitutus sp.]|nr:site-specific integrase [Opitutus sp.]